VTNTPQFFEYGTSDMRRVNGIDFLQCSHIPDLTKPHRVKHTFRIGDRLVPRWLYELTLDMAKQLDRADRSAIEVRTIGAKTEIARAVDGAIYAKQIDDFEASVRARRDVDAPR